jgi:PAS domain S-box-containing protein
MDSTRIADDRLRTSFDVLLIEHDPADELALTSAMTEARLPYRVAVARDVAQARATLAVRRFDLIFVDYELGDGTALELVSAFAGQPVILTATANDDEVAVHALQLHAHDCLIKDRQRAHPKLLALRVATTLRAFGMTQRLLETEVRYRALLECSLEAVCIHRGDTFLYANPAALALLGANSVEELLGKPLSARVHPDAPPLANAGVDSALTETVLLNQKGEAVAVEARSTPIVYDAEPAVHTAMRDISARLRAENDRRLSEAQLRESEQRYRNLVETTQDLITRVDHVGRFTFVNRSAETVFGLSCAECIGLSAFDFVHEDDRAATQHAFSEWMKQDVPRLTFENRQVSRSGEVRVMHWSIAAARLPPRFWRVASTRHSGRIRHARVPGRWASRHAA